eukprot:TRINITY_DN3331_c0_g1_i1.p1 TRINITY_DN3331_c0_g1~~TRINITY_DN3331_c0_g1_i1.p1  ORF type:complete len:1133 (+),score=404.06 TRINITY_DN3331_c0_g1_i1:174-3401(+)
MLSESSVSLVGETLMRSEAEIDDFVRLVELEMMHPWPTTRPNDSVDDQLTHLGPAATRLLLGMVINYNPILRLYLVFYPQDPQHTVGNGTAMIALAGSGTLEDGSRQFYGSSYTPADGICETSFPLPVNGSCPYFRTVDVAGGTLGDPIGRDYASVISAPIVDYFASWKRPTARVYQPQHRLPDAHSALAVVIMLRLPGLGGVDGGLVMQYSLADWQDVVLFVTEGTDTAVAVLSEPPGEEPGQPAVQQPACTDSGRHRISGTEFSCASVGSMLQTLGETCEQTPNLEGVMEAFGLDKDAFFNGTTASCGVTCCQLSALPPEDCKFCREQLQRAEVPHSVPQPELTTVSVLAASGMNINFRDTPECVSDVETQGGGSDTCVLRLEDMSADVQALYFGKAHAPGFGSASLPSAEVFYRVQHINRAQEMHALPRTTLRPVILWWKPTASIVGGMSDALLMLILFVVATYAAHAVLVLLQMKLLVRPILATQRDMHSVAHMQLEVEPRVLPVLELRRLQDAFMGMLRQLREYRSYLPLAVLQGLLDDGDDGGSSADPPQGAVAVAFVDVVGSTELWLASPGNMQRAVMMFTALVRSKLRANGGYEVKTIGDAFMSSFASAEAAVRFGLQLQEALVRCQWPEDAAMEEAGPWGTSHDGDGHVLWHGPRVRIGVCFGDVITEVNPVTERIDYRGGVVNTASRLQATAPPGLLHVHAGCRSACDTDPYFRKEAVCHDARAVQLKGIGDVQTFLCVPRLVRGRLDHVGEVPALRAPVSHDLCLRSWTGALSSSTSSMAALAPCCGGAAEVTTPVGLAGAAEAMCPLELCMTAAVRTGGVIGAVTGPAAHASWNVVRICAEPDFQMVLFAALLHEVEEGDCRVGAAAGLLTCGQLGTSHQRFHVVVGLPTRCTLSLAALAVELGVPCLAVWLPETPPALAEISRPIDVWRADTGELLTVEQPQLSPLLDRDRMDFSCIGSGRASPQPCWGPEYRLHFEAALVGGSEAAADFISASADDDNVLRYVARLLREHLAVHPNGASSRVPAPFTGAGAAAQERWADMAQQQQRCVDELTRHKAEIVTF